MADAVSVVMVSASFHPYLGGAEKQALELSVALQKRGAAVRVLTRARPGLPRTEEVRGVAVRRLWCSGGGSVEALTFMLSVLRWLWRESESYAAIHVHLAGSPALAAAAAGRLLGKRVIVKLGGGKGIGELAASAKTLPGRLKLRALSLLKPQFVIVTPELAAEAAEHLGAVSVRLQPNGVDTAFYRPSAAGEKARLRARLGWPEGLCFLFVGRLSPEKRLETFLDAWAEAAAKAKTASCAVLVGDGPDETRLKAVAARHTSTLRASRAQVCRSMENIQEAYAAADVFVLPSISEGFSNALLEAMASGLAVLASRVGGAVEAVSEARTGFLFDPHDARDLKSQISKFIEHADLAPRMGQAGRTRAVERYSIEHVAERYERLYRGEEG